LSKIRLTTLTALTCFLTGIGLSAQAPAKDEVMIIPHTHWEGAVFKTREEYLEEGLPNILKALYLLKKYPNYRFVLDQMCYVRPFIERYPAEVATFREMLAQGLPPFHPKATVPVPAPTAPSSTGPPFA
jgi:hypothetical protein